jgi:RNA polymerase sigma-70 factor (ECF subfamily)
MDHGDADADVYEKHADELVRFATGLVGPSDAPDVLSVAVIKALTSPRWPGVSNRRAYLYRSVLNTARSHHRSEEQRRARETRYAASSAPEPEPVRPEVLDALGRLSVRQRAVVHLTYWDDLAPASVAELLGISEGSVRRHLARARSNLRRTLRDA